jgi:rSAM/selenodomain-associated transferase 2
MAASRISVVIPARDEEVSLAGAIGSVEADAEVIVVDGCSQDRTREVAAMSGALVVSSPPSRGVQLQTGVGRASGDWLLFLHADTWLEAGWAEAILGLGPDIVGGAFRFAIDAPGRGYRFLETAVSARCALLRLPYGDQALFARRAVLARVGGVAPLPLMEDVDLARRLRREGPLAFLEPRAFTSPRRWERHGLVGATLRNWCVLALYTAGVPPARLVRLYGSPATPPPPGAGAGASAP